MFRCLITGWILTFATTVSAQEIQLFDGQTLKGWTTLAGKPVTKGWEAKDGVLHLDVSGGRAGHIITDVDYENFDFRFEFQIAKKGNSGIKYRVRDFGGKVLGCEYQIFDDTIDKKLAPNKQTASLYDVYEPTTPNLLKMGEYNTGRIVVNGNRIQHWLNGRQVVSAEVAGSDWFERVGKSKFKDVQGFGQTPFGRIMLTDHNSEVWYRNLKLRLLTPKFIPAAGTQFSPAKPGITTVK